MRLHYIWYLTSMHTYQLLPHPHTGPRHKQSLVATYTRSNAGQLPYSASSLHTYIHPDVQFSSVYRFFISNNFTLKSLETSTLPLLFYNNFYSYYFKVFSIPKPFAFSIKIGDWFFLPVCNDYIKNRWLIFFCQCVMTTSCSHYALVDHLPVVNFQIT